MNSTVENDIIRILNRLDIPGNAAKIYLFLLKTGPANGYTISNESGVNSAVVYRELERLKAKNLVYQLGVKPKKFEAINANRLLERLQSQNESEEAVLEKSLKSLLGEYKTLISARITEYDDLISEIRKEIQAAKRDIYIRVWIDEYTQLEPLLREAHENKVEIYLLSFTPILNPIGNSYSYNIDPGVFKDNWKRGIAISVDHEKTIIGNKIGRQPIEGLITNDQLIVESIRDQIQLDIELAKSRRRMRTTNQE
jgi:sugar-specific transcriptional regulator TrmB